MKVGKAQRDIPAHVAQEYCRPDRSFDPLPTFNEQTLPRSLTFYNWVSERDEGWFPLGVSTSSGLGVDFALCRAAADGGWGGGAPRLAAAHLDLLAVGSLDKIKTNDLTLLRDALRPIAHGSVLEMS